MTADGFTITRAIQSRSWPAASANLEYAAVWGSRGSVSSSSSRRVARCLRRRPLRRRRGIPRRWFLAVVTPAENRASGGLIGNVGEITATGGKLDLTAVARVARLNEAVDDAAAAKVLPPIYAQAYGEWKVPAKLQNVTVAADFPTAAEALEAVQPLAGRGEVELTVEGSQLSREL